MLFDGHDEAMSKETWMGSCSTCHKLAPPHDLTELEGPPGWYYYSCKVSNGEGPEDVTLLACSNACRKLDWKRTPLAKEQKVPNVQDQSAP